MPKFRTTNREMMNESVCYAVGYGDLQNLFAYKNAVAYTCGVYGWNADFYCLCDTNTYISTGYRPCGYRLKDSWIYHALDKKAEKIRFDNSIAYDDKTKEIDALIYLLYQIISEDWRITLKNSIWNDEDRKQAKERYNQLLEKVKAFSAKSEN